MNRQAFCRKLRLTKLRPIFLLAYAAIAQLAVGAAASAQISTARKQYETLTERPKVAPEIPTKFAKIITAASPDQLHVRGLRGQSIAVDIGWYDPSDFRLFQDGRFLGMKLEGYEDFGYYLVDRAMAGGAAVISTGDVPRFSGDGRLFAATGLSEAGWSNLEGIAVWEVTADATKRRFFTDAVPFKSDWRVETWVRPNCVSLSAVEFGWMPPKRLSAKEAALTAPRQNFAIEIGPEIIMRATDGEPACNANPAQ